MFGYSALLPLHSEAALGKGRPVRMTHFLGTHQNRLDAKGRVSVPAPFRNVLRAQNDSANGTAHMVLRPSHQHQCIDAWPPGEFDALEKLLSTYDLFSPEHDAMAAALYSDAFSVESDKEGRIMLPDTLVEYAGLKDSVVFMGLGRFFQIWEPAAANHRRAEAREQARERGFTLPQAARAAAERSA